MKVGTRVTVVTTAALLGMTGICLLSYVVYVRVEAQAFQQDAFERLVVEAHAAAPMPTTRREGDLLGEIISERIGLRAAITEGESDGVLRHAIGHVPDTVVPGEIGNAALAGHRDGLFRPLRHIEVGDMLTVRSGGREVHYQVEWTSVVTPEDVWVMGPTSGRTLTLITCYPFSFIGAAPNRFIVRAREQLPRT